MKPFEFITLTAKKVKETDGIYKGFHRTEIRQLSGILKMVIPASSRQPRKDKKFITVNCCKYKLKWL